MLKRVLYLIAAITILAAPATNAKDMTGLWGFGCFNSDAPVGASFWLNDKLGIDLSIWAKSKDIDGQNASSFWFESDVSYVMKDSKRVNIFVRPGLVFARLDDRVYGTGVYAESWTKISLKIVGGTEVFLSDNLSIWGAHGFKFNLSAPPNSVDGSSWNFETGTHNTTEIGFHFYFKQKQ